MGHFSVPCGLSGLPITHLDPIIGFNVELAEYDHDDATFIPTNFPIEGRYDNYGSMENFNGEMLLKETDNKRLVLCHKELWLKAASCWDKPMKSYNEKSNYVTINQYIKLAHEKLKLNIHSFGVDRMMYLKGSKIIHGIHTRLIDLMDKAPSHELLIEWNKKIREGTEFTQHEEDIIYQLCLIYSHSRVSGRQITPTNHCRTPQDTDYKLEVAWHESVAKFATKLQKK